jgi:hypothetical protein
MKRMRILEAAKRKRGLTVRDFWFFDLEEMVHAGLLDKSYPKKGRGAGWPYYRLSRRGRKALQKEQKAKH